MDINARGTLFAMQHAARAMIAQGSGGTIVNIASMAAKAGGNDEGAYAAGFALFLASVDGACLTGQAFNVNVTGGMLMR